MPTAASQLTDVVLQRVFDAEGLGADRALVRTLLTHVQRNLVTRYHTQQTATTFTLQPSRSVYALAELASNAIDVTIVRVANQDLPEIPWRDLMRHDVGWLSHTGRPHAWAKLGLEQFIVHPAPLLATSCTVLYTTLPDDFSAEDTLATLTTERLPLLRTLTEALLLLRGKTFDTLTDTMERLKADLGRQMPGGGGVTGAS